jgi:hypothetical protein
LTVGSHAAWNDFMQLDYFGDGPSSSERDGSSYRLRSTNLVGYSTLRPSNWLAINGTLGVLDPSILRHGPAAFSRHPDTRERFAGDIVFAESDQPVFVHTEVSITADTRDFPLHPNRGGLLRAVATHYADQRDGTFSFARYEAEAAQFIPLAGSRVVLAVHGWLVGSDTAPGQFVPFYLQPSLGGQNTLRGYADYRFHDRHALTVTSEARIAVMTHIDAAIFMDAGNVAPRLDGLSFDKRSYGTGLRLHSKRQTFARADVAHSDEGWRIVLRLFDPLDLARLSRRMAAAPFTP